MDKTSIRSEVIIAEIQDEVLLGMDILKGSDGKPADIILSKNIIRLNGQEIKCTQHPQNSTRTVQAADDFIIQGHTEQVIDAFVQRCEGDDTLANSSILIEPSENFELKFPLVMASSLADLNFAPTVKVRVMNPFPSDATIRINTIIGTAEFLSSEPFSLLEQEEASEAGNSSSARRLKFSHENETSSACISAVSSQTYAQDQILRHGETSESASFKRKEIPNHLQTLYFEATKGRNYPEKCEIANLLDEYQDVFSKDENDLGLTSLAEHSIDTGTAKPVKQPFRRVPLAFANEEKEAINKLLDQGVIRPSKSPWASPLCLVRKKDGSVRPCVDYRRLNKVTKPDAFPVPKVDECIDAVSGSKIFSTLDLTCGYFQVPVRKQDIPKTAFVSKHGLYEFTSTPFGMINSGATFQRVMELALKGLQWHICIIYIDDCIIFSATLDEHIQRLKMVLQRFREANLKLKPQKCELLKREVTFLGFRVTSDGARPDPNNVSKVLQWPVPCNVTEVKQFLGLCSYYRKHVKNFSIIAKPLFDLTKKDSTLLWTDDCQIAFNSLKGALTSKDVMALPDSQGGQFILDVDSCNFGTGAVLSQIQGGEEKVIAYASRSLNRHETNYCVTDKELLAIRYFVEYFRHYLLGRPFIVRSDHRPLKFLFSLKSPSGRIARWIEILSGYDFEVHYRQGARHGNADGMSRCRNPKDCSCPDVDMEESLKCGPCKKCLKRAEQMESSMLKAKPNETEAEGFVQHQISRCVNDISLTESIRKGLWEFTCSSIKHVGICLISLILLFLGTNGDILSLDKVTLYSSACCALVATAKNRLLPVCTIGIILVCMLYVFKLKFKYTWKFRWKIIQIFWQKIWALWYSVASGIELLASRSEQLCRSVTTRSQSDVGQWVPWSNGYSIKDLQDMQEEDSDIGPVVKWFSSGSKPEGSIAASASPATRYYLQCWDALVLKNGILMRKFEKKDGSGVFLQLITPNKLRKDVMYQMHNSILSGHLGRKKTKEKVLQRYYWYQVREDVNLWVSQCDVCGANKPPVFKPRAPLGSMPVGAPLDRLSTDLIGPFPRTPRGNRYILVVTDQFSKWVEIIAIPDQTAETTARTILNEVIARFGSPISIHSDLGSNYESRIFRELCDLLEIKKSRTSVRNPKGNGQTERFNKTLIHMIRAYLTGEQNNWDLNLGCLAAAYRATPNESTKLTPNLLMLGKEVRLPAEIAFGSSTVSNETVSSYGEYVEKLKSRMQSAHKLCRKHLKENAKRQTDIYDQKQVLHKYEKGDLVWFLQPVRKETVCPKLQMPYSGPFMIKERLNNQNYLLLFSKDNNTKVIHHDKLKPYLGNSPPKWIVKAKESLQ